MEAPRSETWVPETRTQRKPHNHIAQKSVGQWDCDACNSIDQFVMTFEYGVTGHRWLIATGRVVPMY